MTKLNSIVRFLNRELKTSKIHDVSKNGLQVKTTKNHIKKVGFAVDASFSTFKKAKIANMDLLIVHHGLLWKGSRDTAGLKKERIQFLKRNKINLYASHLPLDLHPEYGNNAQLAKLLGLERIKKFGRYHGIYIGCQGETGKKISLTKINNKLEKFLKTKNILLNFGKPAVKTVGIVSGGGASALDEASTKNLDCFITGEASHGAYHKAKDLKQNVILGGHYKTETVGVKALMGLIKDKFDVKTVFIDHPTGM